MQSSPIKDKDLGIAHSTWGLGDDKFREVRQKAVEERQELKHRSKKEKEVKVPLFAPGDRVVVSSSSYRQKQYQLVEVVDFNHPRRFDWMIPYEYFAIVLKITSKEDLHRVGRLTTFSESHSFTGFGLKHSAANVDEADIKWLEVD